MKPVPVNGRLTSGASITEVGSAAFRLEIPPGARGNYRLAQLDDYSGLNRAAYPWNPPLELSLRARAGSQNVPGTWGFGFWNAPTSFTLGLGSSSPFPALPHAAWFFFAPEKSFLTFRNDLPGRGFLAQTFRSQPFPVWLALPGLAAAPFLAVPPAARRIRRFMSRKLIQESGAGLGRIDLTTEHDYRLEWLPGTIRFEIDGDTVLETDTTPRPPLALVFWIDNQYAAFGPDGRLRYGLHGCPEPQWLEFSDVQINGRPVRPAAAKERDPR